MIELILSILVDFGLIRADYKHEKRISEKEKKDGVKRPFQKYFLQPTVIVFIPALLIIILCSIIFSFYQYKSVYPKKTKKELSEITEWTEKWKMKYGHYPTELNEMIGNNPIRQGWKKDAWNREYKFMIAEDGKGFLIISAGSDGKFKTEDDIKSN